MLTKDDTLLTKPKISTNILKAVLSNIDIYKLRNLDAVRNSAKQGAEDKTKKLLHLEDGIRNFFKVDNTINDIFGMLLDTAIEHVPNIRLRKVIQLPASHREHHKSGFLKAIPNPSLPYFWKT